LRALILALKIFQTCSDDSSARCQFVNLSPSVKNSRDRWP